MFYKLSKVKQNCHLVLDSETFRTKPSKLQSRGHRRLGCAGTVATRRGGQGRRVGHAQGAHSRADGLHRSTLGCDGLGAALQQRGVRQISQINSHVTHSRPHALL